MLKSQDTSRFADFPPQTVLQALLATSLTSFTEFAFGVVRPDVPFKPNWHFEAVTHKLSQVASGNVRRLIITLPPRTLKSLCASVALPAWFLGHYPWERVVVVSYSDFLARTHANDFRRLVNHPSSRTTGQIALSAWTPKRCKLRGCRGISADAALTFCAPVDAWLRSSMLPVVGCDGAGIAMISVMRAARPRRITVNSSRRRRSGSGWPAVEICWSNFRRSQRECTGGAITA